MCIRDSHETRPTRIGRVGDLGQTPLVSLQESLWVRSETGGVPTWSTGTLRPSTRAAIIVRAGIADETPETRGWLAVAKDLALCVSPPDGITAKGSVRGLYTLSLIHISEPT